MFLLFEAGLSYFNSIHGGAAIFILIGAKV